ncbi:MAG: leucyl aminopeptidase family protein [Rhodobacteraceae bacterium]|nr:leucyl aminopeptidase family protein [Paracoccaceae bacterium]
MQDTPLSPLGWASPAPRFAPSDSGATPVTLLAPEGLEPWLESRGEATGAWVRATGFGAGPGEVALIPGPEAGLGRVLLGMGSARARERERFTLARAAARLPAGCYRLEDDPLAQLPRGDELAREALGWLLSGYRFERYRTASGKGTATLVAPDGVDVRRLEAMAAGEVLTRDLINTPASDMGPEALEAAFLALARAHGAEAQVIAGDAPLEANFPLVHAVGRAAAQAPRLLDLRWGSGVGPRLTLVGKGVCFDTGGLNLKPGGSMGLMKKDMGGAATAMGLAHVIMSLGLDLRLRLLVPAVENAVSAPAMRPGDILRARNGLSVEINNTDAEGRLVLADALALAAEETPDLMISMATLTGAARVALGPDLPALFCDDDATAAALYEAGLRLGDPVWRMPFWPGYEPMIEPGIADLDNAPSGGMAGAITAALFLRRFAGGAGRYAHLDLYGWSAKDAPGRSKGGLGQGARAVLGALSALFPA